MVVVGVVVKSSLLSVCLPSLAWSWPVGVVGEWCVWGVSFGLWGGCGS